MFIVWKKCINNWNKISKLFFCQKAKPLFTNWEFLRLNLSRPRAPRLPVRSSPGSAAAAWRSRASWPRRSAGWSWTRPSSCRTGGHPWCPGRPQLPAQPNNKPVHESLLWLVFDIDIPMEQCKPLNVITLDRDKLITLTKIILITSYFF